MLREAVEAVFQYLPTHRDQPNLRLAFHEEFPKNTCLFDIELKVEVFYKFLFLTHMMLPDVVYLFCFFSAINVLLRSFKH